MKYSITGFKSNGVKSIHSATVEGNVNCLKEMARAFNKGADYIYIRKIA